MELLLNAIGGASAAGLVQFEIGAQVDPLHVLVGRERRGRAAPEDDTVVHDVRAVRDLQRLRTLWSVISTDARSFRWKMIFWISVTRSDRSPERLVEQDELRDTTKRG